MPSGKQKKANMVRNQLQKHIDTTGCTQQSVIDALRVNSGSFRKFMNPKTYKNPMSAMQNGTYWAGGRFLDHQVELKKQNKATDSKKHKSSNGGAATDAGPSVDKKTAKMRAELLMETLAVTDHGGIVAIYDSCPHITIEQVFSSLSLSLCRSRTLSSAMVSPRYPFAVRLLVGSTVNSLNTFLSNNGNHGWCRSCQCHVLPQSVSIL